MRYLGDVSHLPEAQQPTLPNLIRHHQRYGLDRELNHRKQSVEKSYSTWRKLAKDSLVEVGFAYLGRAAFGQLIEAIGYGHLLDDALAAYDEERGE